MTDCKRVKIVHEGAYAAEVEVLLTEAEQSWGPYLSTADAEKLDAVREALRREDLETARKLGKVYRLTPI